MHNSRSYRKNSSGAIFCDGSWSSSRAEAGMASIFMRDSLIQALCALSRRGIRSSREAEGEALLLGLKLASSLKLVSVCFFSDSTEVVSAVFNGLINGTSQPDWLPKCLEYLSMNAGWSVLNCYREENLRADMVAKFSKDHKWSWCNLDSLPRITPLCSA